MTVSLSDWLQLQGLEQYTQVLADNGVDLNSLRLLTDADLQALGVLLGHRRKLLHAIAGLDDSTKTTAPPEPSETASHDDAERRQLSVMFCDLVGSTALSQRLDPEELRRLIRQYQDACVGAITRFEGYVAQYLGDGVLAYFGYPVALEGGAERAVHAALAVIERVRSLATELAQPLRVRIGIDTGLVVIGRGDSLTEQERTAIGDAPNIAARLQGLAAVDSVVLSERTRALIAGAFEFQDLGKHVLKGITDPVQAWQVSGERTTQTRFDVATGGRIDPMVGREMELDLALTAWGRANQGRLQVLLLCGEPGIGKSRIGHALRDQLVHRGAQIWQFQCSMHFINSALYPITTQLERALRFERDESPECRLRKLEGLLMGELGRPALEVNLLGRVFNLPVEAQYGPLAMSPQKQKEETLRAIIEMMQAASRRQPLLLLFEDMHWADPTTLEVIDQLLRRADIRALVVLTYRPEFRPSWIGQAHVSALTLGRLDAAQIESVVRRVTRSKPLPPEILAQIVSKTDGVPLFVEELTKAILEMPWLADKGDRYELSGPLPALAIPSSLRDSLMSRLDRLAAAKEIAQIGACIGREFSDELLALVSPLSRAELNGALDRLINSELVFKRGSGTDTLYVFKHALVQDTAHDSLLKSRRAEVHGKIAKILQQRFPDIAHSEPELIAAHLTTAGLPREAIPFWLKAGETCLARTAIQEAVSNLQNGLEQLPDLQDVTERQSFELDLRVVLAMAWTLLKGWASKEVFDTQIDAWRILESTGTRKHATRVLWGIWAYHVSRGEAEASLQWVRRMLDMADQSDDETLWFVAHWSASIGNYWHGDFVQCAHHAELILERYDPSRHGPVAEIFNYDALTVALLHRAHCEARMGYSESAVKSIELAHKHATQLNAPVNMAYVHHQAAMTHLARRDGNATLKELDALQELSLRYGLQFFSAILVPFLRAEALCVMGHYEESLQAFERVRPTWQAIGLNMSGPDANMYSAVAHGMLERVDEGLAAVERSLSQIAQPGFKQRTELSEVLRVKGWLLEKQGNLEAAESAFRESLDTSRAQRAKTHELRTAISYARLLRSQNRAREARELLHTVYAGFTEGFDTQDLRDAKALLAELEMRP